MSTACCFSLPTYSEMAGELANFGHLEPGALEHRAFPDGERYLRIESPVRDRDVVIVGGTVDDASTLMLFDLAVALVHGGARRLTLIVPYFGYSTMERATRAGEVVTAKCRAELLSAIPRASYGNRVVLFDLHSEGIPHYFGGGVATIHVYGKRVVADLARRLAGDDFVLACTDAGRAKWVESLASDLGVPAAFVYKHRIDGATTKVTGVSARVEGRRVVIYDDMIRTGGSLLQAAQAYRDAGAIDVSAICSHGIFPGDALTRLTASGLLSAIACTDSHPRARALAEGGSLMVESVAPLFVPHV